MRRATALRSASGPLLLALLSACSGGTPGRAALEEKREGNIATVVAAAPDAAVVTPPGAAPPYALGPLDQATSLRGVVTLAGTVSSPAAVAAGGKPVAAKTACGTPAAPRLRASAAGGVAGAVVWLEDIRRGKAPVDAPGAEVGLRGCRFTPEVALAPRIDGELVVRNDDPIRHEIVVDTIAADGAAERMVAVPAPLEGQRFAVPMPRPGLVRLGCSLHADEEGWAWVARHPYHAVTDADGRFVLDGVPPGKYRLNAWHAPAEAGGSVLRAEAPVEAPVADGAEVTLVLSR